jgi:hypothetical protein
MARDEDALRSADALLRHAAAADATHAHELLDRLTAPRLLDLIVTQAELAVDEDRSRAAGIDVVAELGRAAIEVMGLPQDAELDLDDDDDPYAPPTVTGWELLTTEPADLHAATVTLPVRPWYLVLVAFSDRVQSDGSRMRHVVAAAADGRVGAAHLRLYHLDDDADVLAASLSRDAADLGTDAPMARALLAALQAAATSTA